MKTLNKTLSLISLATCSAMATNAPLQNIVVEVPSCAHETNTLFFCHVITETTTNWTRLEGQWREVGIIVEETKARIVWNGKTNLFTLESKEVGTTGPRDLKCNLTNAFDTNITYLIWPNSSGGGR